MFYVFLQNVYNIYPENEFHMLIQQAVKSNNTDAEIYADIQQKLSKIKQKIWKKKLCLDKINQVNELGN